MVGRKKEAAEIVEPNTHAWLVTFSDLVMLLLTFFVLLLSMSSMDTKKLKSMFAHFKGATGTLEFSGMRGVHDLTGFIKKYQDTQGLLVIDPGLVKELLLPSMDSERELESKLKDFQKAVSILDDNRGIVLSIQENLIFDPGESRIKEEVLPILEAISRAIDSSPNDILIMGHTDDVPIKNARYDSNWELSAARGLSVLDFFIEDKNLPTSRFTVGGYGPSRPLIPNNTPKNRAINRRVEIIFKHIGEG
jgi:chemotaxis protein MotB